MPQKEVLDPEDDEMHLDGCLCGAGIAAGEATGDVELPPAAGGVSPSSEAAADVDGDMIDCGVAVEELTRDEDLPTTSGGVA